MKLAILKNKEVVFGISFLLMVFAYLPIELLVSIVIFGIVCHGGITLIKMATSHDLKAKEIKTFEARWH